MRRKTVFCDIDGTILEHPGTLKDVLLRYEDAGVLNNVHKTFLRWDKESYCIVLVTGRKESARKATEEQLARVGIFYDYLLMGIGNGQRIVINDNKPGDDEPMAVSYIVKRNEGFPDDFDI